MSDTLPPPEPRPDRSKVVELGDDRRYSLVAGHVSKQTIGLIFDHPAKKDRANRCRGSILFDIPENRGATLYDAITQKDKPRPLWTVERAEPLTLSPSLDCSACGEHGFIRDDQWVPA